MQNLSNIVGMPLISLFNGTTEGIIKNAIFSKDLSMINGFLILKNMEGNELVFLSAESIFQIGSDAVIIKNNNSVVSFDGEENNPINSSAYSTSGKFLGLVSDISFNSNFKIKQFKLFSGEEVSYERLFSFSKSTMIFSVGKKRFLKSDFDDEIKQNKTSDQAQIQQNVETLNHDASYKKIANYNFILGRKATRDIYSFSNELLIKSGTLITRRIVHLARNYGKLKELYSFS